MKHLFAPILILASSFYANGQQFSQIKSQKKPLVLESAGSFYVGGNSVSENRNELGNFAPEGHITTGQMYVQYMKPHKTKDNTNFVMIHGMTLTGKCYETTPDGRMGWYEYFVRKGYGSFVVDQAGFGRSGFDPKSFNNAKSGNVSSDQQPSLIRISDENVWINFRYGTETGKLFSDGQYSQKSYTELSRQAIPFKVLSKSDSLANMKDLSILSSELKNTILVSHSQSGSFPLLTALLNPNGIKGIVIVEPGTTADHYTDEEIKKLSQIPILIIFGDHLENQTGIPGHSWKVSYLGWKKLLERIDKAGGTTKMLYLPEIGIKGNSHMIMQDDNNIEVADLILKWKNTLR
jgi:pimeloyl-ACP methyl ester carboxylesterase